MNSVIILCIGLLAQVFFSVRTLVQWILSEKARKSLSPTLFWVFSLAGAYLLCLYGWLRCDFAIVLGQFISYYIYLWNLNAKGFWKKIPWMGRAILLLTPVAAICFAASNVRGFIDNFLQNEDVPIWLLIFGSAGQVIFTMRFIYQWYYSHRIGESRLPSGFWWISLVGSMTIVIYGIIRLDPILILGQSFGLVAYLRNLMLIYKEKKRSTEES